MVPLLDILITALTVLVALPGLVFAAECLLGLLPVQPAPLSTANRPRLAVLVPAHDEATGLGATLASVRAQLQDGDRFVVIADNCSDGTAEVARLGGAEVAERFDPMRRGKGFALAFGVAQLADDPPDVVVVVDADCQLDAGCLDALAHTVRRTGRPAQGEYLLRATAASPLQSLNALAFLVRNAVRPRGLRRIGGPTQLTGSGMAFAFAHMEATRALGASIVEDLVLGLDLAERGAPPIFVPAARIWGELPARGRAALGQRRRWEHGQLATLARYAPRLLGRGLRGRLDCAVLGADLLVPPLSLLLLMLCATLTGVSAYALLGGSTAPLFVAVSAMSMVAIAVLLAWWHFGRSAIPFTHLLAAPFYVAWKLPIYAAMLLRRPERRWVRTGRRESGPVS